jgi:hypothetical protein
MASRGTPPAKRRRREDDDDESRCQRNLEKGKELATKDANEEPLFDDTKFVVACSRAPSERLKMLVRTSTSTRIMKLTRTQA